jgi:hypothetical protein
MADDREHHHCHGLMVLQYLLNNTLWVMNGNSELCESFLCLVVGNILALGNWLLLGLAGDDVFGVLTTPLLGSFGSMDTAYVVACLGCDDR